MLKKRQIYYIYNVSLKFKYIKIYNKNCVQGSNKENRFFNSVKCCLTKYKY